MGYNKPNGLTVPAIAHRLVPEIPGYHRPVKDHGAGWTGDLIGPPFQKWVALAEYKAHPRIPSSDAARPGG